MLDGIGITELKRIPDDRGCILHCWRYAGFKRNNEIREVYATTVKQGVVKGWHLHMRAATRYVPLVGEVKIVVLDPRLDSSTHGDVFELVVGYRNFKRVDIPPGVWIGMQGLAEGESLLLNITDVAHNQNEMLRSNPHEPVTLGPGCETDYDWSVRDR